MKKKLLLILCSLILSFLIFSCDEEKPVEPTPTPPETIIADNTAQVDSNNFKMGLVSIDSAQIVYSSSNSFTQTLVMGGYIVSDFGGGILRKIESIQTQGSEVIIGTRHARLDEVILKGTIDFRGTLSPEGMIIVGGSHKNVKLNKKNGEITIPFRGVDFGVSDLEINSETSFDPPEFIFRIVLNWGIESFEAGVVISNDSYVEINSTGFVNVTGHYSPPWAQIAFYPGIPTPIPLLHIVPKIKVVFGGEVRFEVASVNRVDASTTISGGITYENGMWNNYSTLNQQFDFNSNIVGVNAYAKMGLSIPRVGFYLNGIAGAFIELELYGKFKVANDNQGWYRGVYAGLGGNAGVEASILGFSIQSPLIEIFQNEWELNKDYFGENTPPEAVFSIFPSTGNTNTIFEFDASLSSDNEDPVSELEVRWDWEDDGNWDTQYSTNKTAAHQYSNTGNYIIRLQMIDTGGLTNSTTKTVEVTGGTGNDPPNEPSNPSPLNGAPNVSTSTNLSWTCSDPDGDPLNYDVYFGTTSNPPLVSPSQTSTSYDPGTLQENTIYYWKILAKDGQGNSTPSPVWSFTTASGSGEPCPGLPTVTYAGKTYNTVLIGSQCWFRENLDVGTMIQGTEEMSDDGTIEKYCYDNNPANCNTYGGLYQWDETMQYSTTPGVQGICPTGWHIPTLSEFQTLYDAVGGDGNALKAIGQGTGGGAGTNTSGFSALLAGYRRPNSNFVLLGDRAYFWSSTAYNYLSLYYSSSNISLDTNPLTSGFSVRCLKD